MTAISVTNLRKVYGTTIAVDDVSFTVAEGEIFGILGPNGAGKTTTVECIAGLREPDAGAISVLGLDPTADRKELHQILGIQLQESQFPDNLKVAEALDLYSSFYRDPADWRELMDLLGLSEKRDTRYRALSGGQKQRLSIALALVGNPKIAILDELTTGLDPQARRDTWSLIERVRDTGITVLLVTHFMDEAERLCDRIAMIDGGQVVALDTPAGLIAQAAPEQQIHFRPVEPLDRQVLESLPEVTAIRVSGTRWTVTGTGPLMAAVAGALARAGVVVDELRAEQRSLEDAFVAFTGRTIEPEPTNENGN